MKRKPRVEGAHYERNYVYNFHFHLIWVTKYRQKAFTTPELVDEMKDILMHIASLNDVEIETMEVMPDHIHMLISFKPKYAPTDIVKALKGGSARLSQCKKRNHMSNMQRRSGRITTNIKSNRSFIHQIRKSLLVRTLSKKTTFF